MTLRIEEFELAWNALSSDSATPGWRTIAVAPAGACSLTAGRFFPGNEEALLAGFVSTALPPAEKLPEGLGFAVSRVDPYGDGKTWVALSRKESGSLAIFTQIVADVVGAMDVMSAQSDDRILRAFISRLRAWQEFMRKGQQPMSPEAEIGLVGELSVLGAMIDEGVPASVAVEGWVGPLAGIQDFEIGTGALEVKSTLSSVGFPAKIGSLDQLDDSVRQPLFVAGARFSQRDSGTSLPEIVGALRQAIAVDGEALRLFGDRLLAAGFQDAHANRYVRRFALEATRILEVSDEFPRLIPGIVPAGVKRAAYEIDLDRVTGLNVRLTDALKKLGAL
jgi:hypothetical protein